MELPYEIDDLYRVIVDAGYSEPENLMLYVVQLANDLIDEHVDAEIIDTRYGYLIAMHDEEPDYADVFDRVFQALRRVVARLGEVPASLLEDDEELWLEKMEAL